MRRRHHERQAALAGAVGSATMPVLVIDGGASESFMHTGADALASVLPNAERGTLAGQTHDLAAEVLAPVLAEFFG